MSEIVARPSAVATTGDNHRLVATYLMSLRSEQSKRTMLSSLNSVARLISADAPNGPVNAYGVPWHALGFKEAQAVAEALRTSGWAHTTVNRHLAATRGVVKAGKYLGVVRPEVADHVCHVALRNLRADHHGVDPTGRLVTKAELDKMFDVATRDDDNLTRRDVAMLAVLARTGMRRSELTGLHVEDWRPAVGELLILRGKGGVKRKTWLTGWTVKALDAWLVVRGRSPGPMFVRVYRGGNVDRQYRPITTQTVYERVRVMALMAGIEPFAPHDLRRRVATLLLDEGNDIATVAKVLGHKQVTTTAIYDRRDDRTAAVASEQNLVFLDDMTAPAT